MSIWKNVQEMNKKLKFWMNFNIFFTSNYNNHKEILHLERKVFIQVGTKPEYTKLLQTPRVFFLHIRFIIIIS